MPTQSVIERDRALIKIGVHNPGFIRDGLEAIQDMPSDFRMTGEDIRKWLCLKDIMPAHPNAWGCLIQVAVKKNLIQFTGEYTHARIVSSHARRLPIYVKARPALG